MEFIGEWTRGEARLWKPFWLGGAVGSIVWSILTSVAGIAGGFAGTFVQVLWIVYAVWVLFAQWRCAFNVDWAGWGYIVRVLVVLQVAGWIAVIVFLVAAIMAIA